jgi:ubiquinone/menaquinone biosynthesis C-methylase UbiE
MNQEIRGKHYHDDTARRQWQQPETILAEMGLAEGMTLVDLGCGEGFFTLPAARIVGATGQIHALDANPAATATLRERIIQEGLSNINIETGRGEETVLCRECADIVFLGIVLHDFESPDKVLANAYLMTRPGGRLVNLDWKKEPLPLGPPEHIKFSPDRAAEMIRQAGFHIIETRDSGQYHYQVTAVKDAA